MSSTHGLKGKVREMVTRMDALRQDSESPRNLNLRQFMAENYTDLNQAPLTPEHLFAELGIEPQRTKVKDVMKDEDTRYLMAEIVRNGVRRGTGEVQREQLAAIRAAVASFAPITSEASGGQRFVSPEVFTDPVMRGAVQSTFYPDLVIREENVAAPQVIVPQINLADARLKESGEAATIEEGSISYGTKTVKLRKKARAIKITYEAIQFSTLSLAQLFFEDVGRILGHSLNGMAVESIVNGDQDDLSEKAAVIGVEDPTKGIQWFDIARVAIQFGLLGRNPLQIIANATTALNYLNMPEVKNKQFPGAALLATMLKSLMTMPESLYVSTKVPANQIVLQDPSVSLVQLTAMPLMVETERIIMKQIQGTAVSIITGFAKLQRNASIVVDGSIPFSANGFPAFMNPLADD